MLHDSLAVGHKKTVIFTLQPMLQAAGGSAGSRFVLVEHTQHKCDKFLCNRTTCQGLGFEVCSIRGQRRRPPLILPQYHQRETPDKFKYEFNEKTTTPGYFLPPPLWHRDFSSCSIPPVGYCDTLVGVSCFFGETINPLSSRVVPLSPEASDREREKNRM